MSHLDDKPWEQVLDTGPHRCRLPQPWPRGEAPWPQLGEIVECGCGKVYRLEEGAFGLQWIPMAVEDLRVPGSTARRRVWEGN